VAESGWLFFGLLLKRTPKDLETPSVRQQEARPCCLNLPSFRWSSIRAVRLLLSRYSLKRKTFGVRLIDHQAIRFKISDMARQVC